MNLVPFRVLPEGVPHVNPTDNSLIEMEVLPEKVGMYYLHIVMGLGKGAVEISGSPFKCEIAKSEMHKKMQEDRQQAADEKLRKQKEEAEKLRLLKSQKEEKHRQRKIECQQRAAEAMRKARIAKEKERQKEEEDRKMRKEIRTGGGFDIKKMAQLRAEGKLI